MDAASTHRIRHQPKLHLRNSPVVELAFAVQDKGSRWHMTYNVIRLPMSSRVIGADSPSALRCPVSRNIPRWQGNSSGSIMTRCCLSAANQLREAKMAVASVSKITAASPTSSMAAIQEALRAQTRRCAGSPVLHVIEREGERERRKDRGISVTMELTFIPGRMSLTKGQT